MRVLVSALVALWCLVVSIAPARAQTTPAWVGGAPIRTRVSVGTPGEAWVGVWVDAPTTVVSVRARAPMAVSFVVDMSGSMAGAKIDNARLAAQALIESLADGDIVSIDGFASDVREIAPPTVLDPVSRGELLRRIRLIVAGGGTNLGDGLRVGTSRLALAPATHPVRRVFLISDGQATIGITDPRALGQLAAGATEWGTQVTAIGVGYDYDPLTLNTVAVQSAGRMHHLGSPEQMGAILETELSWMSRSVALGAMIEVRPAVGVTILEAATLGAVIEGGVLRLPLGAVTAGQRRELLFRVRMPTADVGRHSLATASLRFDTPDGGPAQLQNSELSFDVGSGAAGAETPRVAAMVAQHDASEAERAAAVLLEQGRRDEAVARLEAAATSVTTTSQSYDFDDQVVSGSLAARQAELRSMATGARAATAPSAMHERAYEMSAAPMAADGY